MKENLVLVVEDEPRIAEFICKYLHLDGFASICLTSGKEVVSKVHELSPDIILLDIMLPDMDGIDVCKKVRKSSYVPIIMLTAKVDEVDRLIGFEAGADDYVCKPFSPRELIARIRAVLNRMEQSQQSDVLQVAGLSIDITQHCFRVKGREIKLTHNEFNVLRTLLSFPNKVFSRQELLASTHVHSFDGYERSIDSHVKNLRKKLNKVDSNSVSIESIYGVGYKLVTSANNSVD